MVPATCSITNNPNGTTDLVIVAGDQTIQAVFDTDFFSGVEGLDATTLRLVRDVKRNAYHFSRADEPDRPDALYWHIHGTTYRIDPYRGWTDKPTGWFECCGSAVLFDTAAERREMMDRLLHRDRSSTPSW